MTLFMRLSRLFKADAHGILDHLEEPEAILKQAVRDMEHEIEKGEADLADLVRREAQQQATVARLHDAIGDLSEQLDICFEVNNDALAKTVIRKKLEAENRLRHTTRGAADLAGSREAKQEQLNEQKAQLQTIIDSMPPFVDAPSPSAGQGSSGAQPPTSATVSDEDVEIAFIREQRQRADRKDA